MKQKENTPRWISELVILRGQTDRLAWVPLPLDPESDSGCQVTMCPSRLFWNKSMAWSSIGRQPRRFHIRVHVNVSPWASGRNCSLASTRSRCHLPFPSCWAGPMRKPHCWKEKIIEWKLRALSNWIPLTCCMCSVTLPLVIMWLAMSRTVCCAWCLSRGCMEIWWLMNPGSLTGCLCAGRNSSPSMCL